MIRASERAGGAACQVGGMVAVACVAALMMSSAAARGAEQRSDRANQNPQPWVTMSLGSLGVPAIPAAFLQVGSSMLTLDVVDNTHLLLTFSSRGLVPRVPGDPPDDEDRMVAAELVELPTCKILARADWHMHDHGRYLWRLGKGRFLVRTQHDLYVITPEARMGTADPLRLVRFPTRDGTPVLAVVSPDKGMLMVQTLAPQKKGKVEAAGSGMIVSDPRSVVMIDFYRLAGGDAPGVPLTVKGAGVVRAPAPLLLPMDADGYLWPSEPRHGQWPVSFNEFGGREVKIVNVDSSCPPRLQMVSRSEFLAFTCKGSDARVRVKSYGLDGHETWEETLSSTFGTPELAYSPDSGRFALSRIVSPAGDLSFGSVIPDGATQEVRIYQTESGDLLLKVPTSPVTRYAENFDLSEDGSVAAVVSAGVIQVYKLPPPSAQDLKDLEEAKGFSPPRSEAPVRFAKLETPSQGDGTDSSQAGPDVAAAMKPDMGSAAGSGMGSGGGITLTAPPLPLSGAAATAPATQGDLAIAPAGADVTKPGAAAADSEGGGGGGSVKPDGATKAALVTAESSKQDDSGGEAAGKRKPPTLLGPGENVEKVKPPTQQQSQQQSR